MTTHAEPINAQEEEDLHRVKDVVGPMTIAQEHILRTAIAENSAGVLALAVAIKADRNVRSRLAVLLTGIRGGKHRVAAAPRSLTATERARGLYDAKLAELDRVATHWSASQRHEFALDYALDHCGDSTGVSRLDVCQGVQLAADDEDDLPW